MRGLIPAAAAIGAALLLLAVAGPSRAESASALLAGAARVEVELPAGVPLGGYGGFPRRRWIPDLFGRHPHAFWFRPSDGARDPFVVRALYLEAPPVRLYWLTVELVGVDPSLTAALRRRLGAPPSGPPVILVSASHTHSGPGAYAESELFALAAVDRPSAEVRERIVSGMERASREAERAKGDAMLAVGHTEVVGITLSRLEAPLDPELAAVKVIRPDGRPVAVLWNYAIHGTTLSARNVLLSGDIIGRASALVEQETGAPALYVNGAVADVSPLGRGSDGLEAGGAALAAGVRRALARAPVERRPRVAAITEAVILPAPRVRLKNCLAGWVPGPLRIPLAGALPERVDIWAVALGSSAWVTVPGELQTSLGLEIKARAGGRFGRVVVAGLTNAHLGYFLTQAAYDQPGYLACASLYGPRGGAVMRNSAASALDGLRREVERP